MKIEELIFEKSHSSETNTYDLKLIKNNKILRFIFGGNGDLCILLFSDSKDKTFEISKENNQVYKTFDKLYKSIANCEIVNDTQFDMQMGFMNAAKVNNEIKNSQIYKELFLNNSINYRSDNQIYDDANILKITPTDAKYVIEFIYKEEKTMSHIEITNSGSRYGLLHVPFMKLYNELSEIDPNYHQMDIEEYSYIKQIKFK